MEIRGDSWRFVGIRGDSWRFVEIRGPCSSVVFHIRGNSWGFVGFRGVAWGFVALMSEIVATVPCNFPCKFSRVEHLKHISPEKEWTESVPRHSVISICSAARCENKLAGERGKAFTHLILTRLCPSRRILATGSISLLAKPFEINEKEPGRD